MTHEAILAAIEAAYLDIRGRLNNVESGDSLLKLKRLAGEAVLHPCSRPKAIRIWEGAE